MKTNKFPLDIFPQEFKEIITELKRTNNFAEDFTALSMLSAVGLAIGNTYHIQAKNNWNVNTALWILFVARSGFGKSPPIKFMYKPIYERDRELNRIYKKDLKEYEDYLKTKNKEELEIIQEPLKQKHIYKDLTPEKLIISMENNKRGIGVHTSEFREFFNNLERYSKSGALFMLNAMYDQDEHSRETMTSSISISTPFLSLIGGITTKDFNFFRHSKISGNGFFERMLVCMPKNLKAEDKDEDIKDELIVYWSNFIYRLLSINQNLDEYGEPEPRLLKYTEGAKLRLSEWNKVMNSKINSQCEEYATLYSKSKATIHKLAGIIHIISCFSESENNETLGEIGNYSLERAIDLLNYFEITHKEILGVSIDSTIKKILKDEDKIEWYNKLEQEFTTTQAMELFDDIKNIERKDTDRTVYRMLEKQELFKKLYETHYRKVY